MRYRGETALVTGASSGIGAEFARALAARGANLVLTARRADRLDDLAAQLREQHGVTVHTLPADLGAPGAGRDVREQLERLGLEVGILVNNAGLGSTGPFAGTDGALVNQQIAVNIAALTELTHELLPGLIEHNEGAVVTVASFLGHQPSPNMAVYGATKAYVLSFTEALAHELRDTGVRVLVLSPGSTTSEFYTTAGTTEQGARFQTPEQVVATALEALDSRRQPSSVVSGARNRFNLRLLRLLPRPVVLNIIASANQPA